MSRLIYAAALSATGMRSDDSTFDNLFNWLNVREAARAIARRHIRGIENDTDREIALWMHYAGISDEATNADIRYVLEKSSMREIESLYGSRVGLAADRGRSQGNHSALRCFVREVRRARSSRHRTALVAVF